MNATVKHRLIEFIKHHNLSQSRFEKAVGLSNGFVNNISKGVGADKLQRIVGVYPNLNPDWLLYGNGEMLKSTLPTLVEPTNYRLVPMYNMDARGGFEGNEEVDTVEYIVDRIPFKDARQDDICIMITGNSMSPTYCAGSIVLLHPIDRWREFLDLGQVYVIILEDGRRLIKELRASEEDKKSNYLCRSHNPDVDPVELPKSMIQKVFIVAAMYSKTIL